MPLYIVRPLGTTSLSDRGRPGLPRSSVWQPEAPIPGFPGPPVVQVRVSSPGVRDTFSVPTSALRLHHGPAAVITNTWFKGHHD
ncbi:hypothetical protein NDU88_000510 [Pleurodeles waltl]|uniref:Uncharacterized protein n=1 Tax=Pleurodeles waltl TaxID=8319 RepID=A0AAV7P4E3_PLEWA|nr:hypothetical protein NDU88_000510 [Pleurodeles waltl]